MGSIRALLASQSRVGDRWFVREAGRIRRRRSGGHRVQGTYSSECVLMLFPRSWQIKAAQNPCRERESAFTKRRVTLVRKKRRWLLCCRVPPGSRAGPVRESQRVLRGRLPSHSHYNPVAPSCFRSRIRSVALARVGVVEQDLGR